MSRPMTKAVSQNGIAFGEFRDGMVRMMKEAVISSLSAAGSRRAPILVFKCMSRAVKPSKMSVRPAMRKTTNASATFPWTIKTRKTGMSRILSRVRMLGSFRISVFCPGFIAKLSSLILFQMVVVKYTGTAVKI